VSEAAGGTTFGALGRSGSSTLLESVLWLALDNRASSAFAASDAQHQPVGVFYGNPGRAFTCRRR
jgi:hypothetical protein